MGARPKALSINAGLLISDMKANLTDIGLPQVLPVTGKVLFVFKKFVFKNLAPCLQ